MTSAPDTASTDPVPVSDDVQFPHEHFFLISSTKKAFSFRQIDRIETFSSDLDMILRGENLGCLENATQARNSLCTLVVRTANENIGYTALLVLNILVYVHAINMDHKLRILPTTKDFYVSLYSTREQLNPGEMQVLH